MKLRIDNYKDNFMSSAFLEKLKNDDYLLVVNFNTKNWFEWSESWNNFESSFTFATTNDDDEEEIAATLYLEHENEADEKFTVNHHAFSMPNKDQLTILFVKDSVIANGEFIARCEND